MKTKNACWNFMCRWNLSIIGREADARHTEFIFIAEILNINIFFHLLCVVYFMMLCINQAIMHQNTCFSTIQFYSLLSRKWTIVHFSVLRCHHMLVS